MSRRLVGTLTRKGAKSLISSLFKPFVTYRSHGPSAIASDTLDDANDSTAEDSVLCLEMKLPLQRDYHALHTTPSAWQWIRRPSNHSETATAAWDPAVGFYYVGTSEHNYDHHDDAAQDNGLPAYDAPPAYTQVDVHADGASRPQDNIPVNTSQTASSSSNSQHHRRRFRQLFSSKSGRHGGR